MSFEYKHLLNNNFHPGSRVWVYQCSRLLSLGEALEAEEMLKEFTIQWKSHGTPVKGEAYLFFGQFIEHISDLIIQRFVFVFNSYIWRFTF